MESTISSNTQTIAARDAAFTKWLYEDCQLILSPSIMIQAMPHDASFRRYFRVTTQNGRFVAMNADPAKENNHAFVVIADYLHRIGIHAPAIMHFDLQQGFLLMSDFGDATYLKSLTHENADALYGLAIDALITMQNAYQETPSCSQMLTNLDIPHFTREWMQQEFAWHREWFLDKLLQLSLTDDENQKLNACFAYLIDSAQSQPHVFMHRDYHSANLMVLPDHHVGILDFQDAFIGPITYDLVSLLRDCYIDWPVEKVRTLALRFFDARRAVGDIPVLNQIDQDEFLRWFDLMGIQRHLKAVFNFARKAVRDQQFGYLQHLPRTLNYVIQVSANYPELSFLNEWMRTKVQPACEKIECAQ